MRAFLDAAGFLTRVPVGPRPPGPPRSAAVRWFPVVGGLVGLVTAVVFWMASWLGPPALAAVLAVAIQILLTGAFHEDGLADTADAAGAWSREERFRILDDPTHGTYGVAALVLALLVRTVAIAGLTTAQAFAVLPAVHALSRAVAVALMGIVPPAAEEGLGASSVRDLVATDAGIGAGAGAAIAALALGVWSLPALAAAVIVGVGMAACARRTLGGIAGDLLGATQQLVDLAALVVLLAAA
ncbi:MAG: adenosylcobinamide-GDP ribazoletransferase, partial [Actinomycetota bacterium]|nr:adenosylcobinamide-GDP ribazoletransferase [Actinomycetota bacterium]